MIDAYGSNVLTTEIYSATTTPSMKILAWGSLHEYNPLVQCDF